MFFNDYDLYDKNSCLFFLNSLGMNEFEIEEFLSYVNESMLLEQYKDLVDAFERDSAGNYELRQNLICEIQDLADELASGKGGTKIRYADRLRKLCEYYA